MTDEEILTELRTIRTLLSLDKEEKLEEICDDLNEVQEDILDELGAEEWKSGFSANLAEKHDISKRTVQRHLSDLTDRNMVEKVGDGGGAKYRRSALLQAAESVGVRD